MKNYLIESIGLSFLTKKEVQGVLELLYVYEYFFIIMANMPQPSLR